jgi:hypothetical protein
VTVDGQAIQADVSYFEKTRTMAAAHPFYTVRDITTRLQLTNHKRVHVSCRVGVWWTSLSLALALVFFLGVGGASSI